jgi:putative transposase
MIEAIEALAQRLPVRQACAVFDFPRSSLYRSRQLDVVSATRFRATPVRALSADERSTVRELLDSQRFVDSSLYAVYATLLDEGSYHCSIRTMYRILHEYEEVQERRNQPRQLAYAKPRPGAPGWRQVQTRSGPGILPKCVVLPSGATLISTPCSIFTVAMGSAGSWQNRNRLLSPSN